MKTSKTINFFHRFENSLAFIFILLIAIIPTIEVVARLFKTGLAGSTEYTHHLVLLITFLGGMITSREKQHLSLALDFKLHDPHKSRVAVAVSLLSALITTALAWASLSFILNGFDPTRKVGPIPVKYIAMVMAIGYAIMAVRFITRLDKGAGRYVAMIGILLGTLIAFEPLVNSLGAMIENVPEFLYSFIETVQSLNGLIAVPMIIILIAGAIFGAPIFVVLGGIAFMLFARVAEPLEVIPNEAYSMLISHSIPAIPLFTVTGFLLSESKAGERLVKLFRAFFSWIPGGLAIMAILVCTFFTTFTGASGVTILALGALLSFVLIEGKYDRKFSIGLLTASGSIGLLFPPSLPIIIYGVAAQVSIKDMFIGGIVPGFVMVLALVIFGVLYAKRRKVEKQAFHFKPALKAILESIWEIMLPVVILLSYFGGLTTLVESAAVALIYTLIVEVFINRDLKIRDLQRVLLKALPIIGGVLTILALAKGLSYFIVDAEVPMHLTEWVKANISSKYIFLLILNVALLITGCFMDIFSAILVVVPLILPLGNIFGIHPVHLGIIFLANMELGYLTPPVGLNLFLASYRFNEPMGKIYKDVIPFFLIQLITVLLITYIPFLSTGLLSLVK